MLYFSEKMNRSIELNDELVKTYLEYNDKLCEGDMFIVVKGHFGRIPNSEELSDSDLGKICDDVILSQLKLMTYMPKISQIISEKRLEQYAGNGKLMEFALKEEGAGRNSKSNKEE